MAGQTFESQFHMGDVVRDAVSGFEGIVESIVFWRHGYVRVGIASTTLNKDGLPVERQLFDEPQLELVKAVEAPKAKPASRSHSPL